jgi:hypothetical protein
MRTDQQPTPASLASGGKFATGMRVAWLGDEEIGVLDEYIGHGVWYVAYPDGCRCTFNEKELRPFDEPGPAASLASGPDETEGNGFGVAEGPPDAVLEELAGMLERDGWPEGANWARQRDAALRAALSENERLRRALLDVGSAALATWDPETSLYAVRIPDKTWRAIRTIVREWQSNSFGERAKGSEP